MEYPFKTNIAKLLVLYINNKYFRRILNWRHQYLFQQIPLMKFSVTTVKMCQCSSTWISVQVLLYPLSSTNKHCYSHSRLKIKQPDTSCRERNFTPTFLSVLSWLCAQVFISKAMWAIINNNESLTTQIRSEHYYIDTKTLLPYIMEKYKKKSTMEKTFTVYTIVLWKILDYNLWSWMAFRKCQGYGVLLYHLQTLWQPSLNMVATYYIVDVFFVVQNKCLFSPLTTLFKLFS